MARSIHALVFESDSRNRETLRYAFEGGGFRVTEVGETSAFAAALTNLQPDVALVVIREPIENGLDLLQELRGKPTTGTRILVLGPPPIRPEIQLLHGVDFLPLPLFVRDTMTACRLLGLLGPQSPEPTEGPKKPLEIQGALSDFGLFFVIRTLAGLGRSAIVKVERAARKGEIRLVDGHIASAHVGTLHGSAALHQLLLWEEAILEIGFGTVVPRGQTFKKGEDLLQETERFLRDFAHATKDLGPVASLFVQAPEVAAQASKTVAPEMVPILRLFDGARTLGGILEDSPFRIFDTIRVVSRLLEQGLIRRKALEKPSSAPVTNVVTEWLATPAPQIALSPASPPQDKRSTGSSRRKSGRRERTGPQNPLKVEVPALRTVAVAPAATNAPAATPSPAPAASSGAAPSRHATGEVRVSQRNIPVMADTPSMVVDLPPDEIHPAIPQQESVPPARQTGVTSAVLSRTPSAARLPRPSASSIEIASDMVSDMDAYELANTPATPPPVAFRTPAAAPAPASVHTAPTVPAIPTAPSGHSFVSPGEPAGTPSPLLLTNRGDRRGIVAQGRATPAQKRRSTPNRIAPADGPRITPNGPPPEQPVPTLPPAAAGPAPKTTANRRVSAEFSALEHEFFAREEELYKRETDDTFEDLDSGPNKRPGPPK